MPRPTRAAPKRAASWDRLAVALGVHARGLHRLRLENGAPKTRDIAAWKAFQAARAASSDVGGRGKSTTELAREAADLRLTEARARLAIREDAIAAGDVVTKAQATAAAAAVRDAFIAEGEALPAAVLSLVPKLGRVDKEAVENAVRAAWQSARERIALGIARA